MTDRVPTAPPHEGLAPPLPIDEPLLRMLLDGTFEGILVHDRIIHYANASAARITGRSVASLVGHPIAVLGASPMTRGVPVKPEPGATYGPFEFEACDGGEQGAPITIEAQGRAVEIGGEWVWLSAFRDISPHRAARLRLLNRLEFEDLITSISAEFIHLEPPEVHAAIDQALARIGEFAKVDRSYVYMIDGDLMRASNVWLRDRPRETCSFGDWTTRVGNFAWAIEKLQADEVVIYEVQETFRYDALRQKVPLPTPQARSSCCVPMIVKDKLLGYLGFDTIGENHRWDEDTTRLLRTVGYILAQLLHRTQAQEELAQAYATMEAEVQRRREELEQQHLQLLHAEKMASLGALVAGVAHEINTPLGAIKSNTDTLVRSLSRIHDALAKADVAEVLKADKRMPLLMDSSMQVNRINVQAIERITGIVNSLRKFARLDQAEIDTIDLHEALDTTLVLVRHEFKHRIDVLREYGELPQVECYPDQINQVFMNLLVNAGQAIEGRGEVRITTRALADGTVTVDFQDTGRGIPPKELARVFDPGFTTKGVGVGTGLGLSIVQRIVDAHHGRVEVESRVGVGSTFRVTLPVRQPPR